MDLADLVKVKGRREAVEGLYGPLERVPTVCPKRAQNVLHVAKF